MTKWITLDPPLPFSKARHPTHDPELRARFEALRFADPGAPPEDPALRALWLNRCEDVGRALAPFHDELKARKTFCNQGLNRVGVQIELVTGQQFLIGDMTVEGTDAGHDGMEYAFDINTKVRCYRVFDIV